MATVLLNDRVMLDQIHVTVRINKHIPHRVVDVDAKLDIFKSTVYMAIVNGLQDLPEPPPEWGVVIEVEE